MATLLAAVGERLLPDPHDLPRPARSSTADQLAAAHQEWVSACAYFNSVSDPGLVDHAIYLVRAAEQKYTYLLRRARAAAPGRRSPGR